jgi:enterochelin esterase-like enzyme
LLVASVFATMFGWNRLRGRFAWLPRLAMILVTNVCAVALTGLGLNSYFGFYMSWRELLGAHATAQAAIPVAGELDRSMANALLASYRSGHGLVTAFPITASDRRIGTDKAMVYLPAAYGDPSLARVRFPVIELLTGFPGNPSAWVHGFKIAGFLDRMISTGEMSPSIVVMPVQNVAAPRDTECADVHNGPQVDTYLSHDVHEAVTRAFRADADGRHWGVVGFSTGGYCAAILAARHPSDFGAASSIEGYDRAAHDRTTGNLFGNDTLLREQADVRWWISHWKGPRTPLLAFSSRQDRQSWADDRALDAIAAQRHWPVWQLTLPRGGHNFGTFAAEMPLAISWISDHIGAPHTALPTVDGLSPSFVGAPARPSPATEARRA